MEHWWTYLEQYPKEYLLIAFSIVLCLLLALVSLCITIFYRRYKLLRAKRKKVLVEAIDAFVQEIIFEHETAPALHWMKHQQKDNLQLFLNRLLLMSRQFSGDYSRQLNQFYNQSPLAALSLKNIKSSERRKAVRAIHEITGLGLENAEWVLEERLGREKNPAISLELGMGMLLINPARAFGWILKQDIYLNEWQQLSILVRVSRSSAIVIPPLAEWTGKNESLVVLGCRLAAVQNRFEDLDTLVNLLGTGSESLQVEVITALMKLEYEQLGDVLQKMYHPAAKNLKIAMLKIFQQLRDKENTRFLLESLSDGEFELCFEALKAIYLSNNASFAGLEIPDFSQTDLGAIRKHIEDPRI